jgi:ribonuclease Z
MQIVTLGTGSPLPDPDRAGPATLVRTAGLNLLFDCGRGVLMRAAAMAVGPGALSVVFLTHLHSDHVTDLNDVITMQWAMSFAPTPLRIIGPVGTADFVDRTLAMLREDISYRIAHHDDLHWQPMVEVTEVTDGVVFEQDGVRVIAQPTDHRPVHPTVGYRVEADERVAVIAGATTRARDWICSASTPTSTCRPPSAEPASRPSRCLGCSTSSTTTRRSRRRPRRPRATTSACW